MEEMKDKNATPQQNAATAEQSGGQGRTFTQDEVNQIVSDRLARERAKHEESPQEMKEKELSARESRLSCREYIAEKKYPVELLDIFDTSDASAFQASVEKLEKVFPQLFSHTPPPRIVAATRGLVGNDLIAQAFRKERLK